jgi:hypothetical protein
LIMLARPSLLVHSSDRVKLMSAHTSLMITQYGPLEGIDLTDLTQYY